MRAKRKHPVKRLPVFRIEPHLFNHTLLDSPPRKLMWMLSPKARWREALDRAAQLLEAVAEQMQEHYDQKSESWLMKGSAAIFQENLQEVIETQALLDDLRSNF